MKKILASAAILALIFTSCSKKNETVTTTTPTTSAKVFLIAKDSSYSTDPSQTRVQLFEFNASKKLVKVKKKFGTSGTFNFYDSIYYNADGKISKVVGWEIGKVNENNILTYIYAGNNLTKVNSKGTNSDASTYEANTNYTYTAAGKIFSIKNEKVTGTVQNAGDIPDLDSISFTGDNLTGGKIFLQGFSVGVIITYDLTAVNPYYGLNLANDFISMFSKNNALKAYAVIDPSSPLVNNTYTYENTRVKTMVSTDKGGGVRTTVFSYQEL